MHYVSLVRIQTVIAFGVSKALHNCRLGTARVIVLHINALVDLYCHLSLGLVVEAADYLSESPSIQFLYYFKAISYVVPYDDLVKAALSIKTIVVVLI